MCHSDGGDDDDDDVDVDDKKNKDADEDEDKNDDSDKSSSSCGSSSKRNTLRSPSPSNRHITTGWSVLLGNGLAVPIYLGNWPPEYPHHGDSVVSVLLSLANIGCLDFEPSKGFKVGGQLLGAYPRSISNSVPALNR